MAQPAGNAVTAEQIRAAEAAESAAAAARDAAAQRRWRVDGAVDRAIELSAGHDAAAAERAQREASTRHTRLVAVARNLDALLGLREAAGKALFEQELRRDDLAASLTAGSTEIGVLSQRTERRAGRLLKARAGHESVAARRQFLLSRAAALDAVAAAAAAVGAALAVLQRAEHDLSAAVVGAGFDGLDDALSAAAIDADGLRRRVRAAEDAQAAVVAQLQDPQFAGLTADEHIDVVGLGRDAEAAAAAADRAISLAHALAAQRDQVGGGIEPAAGRMAHPRAGRPARGGGVGAHRGHARPRSERVGHVAAHLCARRAVEAGRRCGRPTAGPDVGGSLHVRAFHRPGVPGQGGRSRVWTSWTAGPGWSGRRRRCPGGESFLASLALALGLADIVAAEAGGRVLDTLFVDEGFGSLDPDTLDLVMGTLDELRAGGRVVGVVSHVDELRQRIPSQVRVCRTPQGSTLEVSTG